jgi:hypothetical protein
MLDCLKKNNVRHSAFICLTRLSFLYFQSNANFSPGVFCNIQSFLLNLKCSCNLFGNPITTVTIVAATTIGAITSSTTTPTTVATASTTTTTTAAMTTTLITTLSHHEKCVINKNIFRRDFRSRVRYKGIDT